jgi:glycosyltransferase involved in cell wall biosynthesis
VRILVLNWRDLQSPWAGGAEVHIHAIASGLVQRGHSVDLLVSGFPGAAATAVMDGVTVRRHGGWWNGNFALLGAARRALRRRQYDVVLEDINKIPFFTPLVHDLPIVVYVPHLFGGTVFRETNALFASYVWLLERPLPWAYRRATWIAISASTKRDLVGRGIPASRVEVVHCGLDFARYDLESPPPRADRPTLVHLGRLMRYKRADVALRTLAVLRTRLPAAQLWIVGDGPDRARLERLARRLELGDSVRFHGHVSHAEKVRLLWSSHLLLNPSPKEGWGLTVVEANACGVPVVASRSPGLVDSVHDGETGLLVPPGDAQAGAEAAWRLLSDAALYERCAAQGRAWVRSLRWEDAVLQTEAALERAVRNARGGPPPAAAP